ncbi:MAG: AAA family ATPase [Verrucomicrobia bacterium]|nr:AAA family ATPase [Verrucomicrobiota bacterium]
MYIKRVELTNIRCFEHVEIDLSSNGDIRKWAVILGDNGVGKTTLLRSIALALGDRESAAALLRDLPGEWVRHESADKTGTIRIDFSNKKRNGGAFYTEVRIQNNNGRESIINYTNKPKNFPWDDIFACGYGAGRSIIGTRSYQKYRTIDSVYSLFDYELPLQNPELTLLRLNSSSHLELSDITESIDQILMLPLGSTTLQSSGICISGPWGEFMPIDTIGDGYKATLAWVVDFVGWAMFHHDSILSRDEIAGIVLIDELEQHLHPRWQRKIIKLLREQFSATQFIATTHSPLCASGASDLGNNDFEVLKFQPSDDQSSVRSERVPSLRGLRADQVLTSSAFDLTETRNAEIENVLKEFRELLLKETLEVDGKKRLEFLRQYLIEEVPDLAEREDDRILVQELRLWLLKEKKSQDDSKEDE